MWFFFFSRNFLPAKVSPQKVIELRFSIKSIDDNRMPIVLMFFDCNRFFTFTVQLNFYFVFFFDCHLIECGNWNPIVRLSFDWIWVIWQTKSWIDYTWYKAAKDRDIDFFFICSLQFSLFYEEVIFQKFTCLTINSCNFAFLKNFAQT